MGKVLLLDKDVKTSEVLKLLLQALEQPYEVAHTHSNATRIYNAERVEAIFMNPELPLVDPKAFMDEIEVTSAERNRSRAPVIFLYTDDQLIHCYELNKLPDSQLVKKPVTMEQIYELLDGLGLTKLKVMVDSQQVKDKIARFGNFIEQSETWMDRLKKHLMKS